MFRLWARSFKNNHVIDDITIEDCSSDTRTAKIVHALTQVCHEFDLAEPIWLESNIRDFKLHRRTRFTRDSFIEEIPFDYLDIQVIEEDWT